MAITAQQVKELRDKTGVSMMACKKALTEADGNEEKAIEILRKKGEAKAAEKSDRSTSEGIVVICENSIAGLRCETDFVARNEDFISLANLIVEKVEAEGVDDIAGKVDSELKTLITKLGENMTIGDAKKITSENAVLGSYTHGNNKIGVIVALENGTEEQARDVAMHIAAMNPKYVNPEEVSEELIAKEKDIWADQLKNEGKPEEMIEKIMMGKENKFRAENALLKQSFVKDPNQTVEQYLGNAKIIEFVRVEI